MQRKSVVQLAVSIATALCAVLLIAHPLTAQVRRLVFVSAGFNESNRFWIIDRPAHLQFDPFLETFLDVDPETGAYTPRLAERWQSSPDLKEWTFVLRKGVPFHFGYGEFTAHDVVHAHSLMLRPEATAEWIRISYYSKGTVHHYENPFIDKRYLELTQAVDLQERERLAREIGEHLFEEFADMPLLLLFNEVVANPKVVAGWSYPGTGAGRSTHFHLLKAVK